MARSTLHLDDGTPVEFFDGAEDEDAAAAVIEESSQPAISTTRDGQYRCWIDGRPVGEAVDSLEQALAAIDRLVAPEQRSHLKPCLGVGLPVSEDSITTAGVHRVTFCHVCEDYAAVQGNRIAFHQSF